MCATKNHDSRGSDTLVTAQAGVVKAVLPCMASVLTAVDPADWPSAVRPFGAVLQRCADPRPKVRRRAQTGLVDVLAALQRSPALPDASAAVLQGGALSTTVQHAFMLCNLCQVGGCDKSHRWSLDVMRHSRLTVTVFDVSPSGHVNDASRS